MRRANSDSSSPSSGLTGHSHATHSLTLHVNPIAAAASSTLAHNIPGVERYTPKCGRRDKGARDELTAYRRTNVDFMCRFEQVTQVAALNQRWAISWMTTLRSRGGREQRSQAVTNFSAFKKDEA
ncbi:hypothetical protein BGW80DRAFT_1341674, partial [Lactifluus volemus]